MSKLIRPDPKYWPRADYGYWCPGCNNMHAISVEQKNHSGASWSFNGDVDRPTFSPSINYKVNTPDMGEHYQPHIWSTICHHFVRDGRIEFLSDCTHAFKGQTVDLPDFPDGQCITSSRL